MKKLLCKVVFQRKISIIFQSENPLIKQNLIDQQFNNSKNNSQQQSKDLDKMSKVNQKQNETIKVNQNQPSLNELYLNTKLNAFTYQKEARFSTNTVLIHRKPEQKLNKPQASTKQIITAYLPGYLRVKLKNFINMDLRNLMSQINADLIFTLYYGDLFESETYFSKLSDYIDLDLYDSQEKQQKLTWKNYFLKILQSQLSLSFLRNSPLLLSKFINGKNNHEITITVDDKQKLIKYTVRKDFKIHLQGDLVFSPFQTIYSLFQIAVQPISFDISINNRLINWVFRVNLMDCQDHLTKLSYKIDSRISQEYGHYALAVSKLDTRYTNKRVRLQELGMSKEEIIQYKNKLKLEKEQKNKKESKKKKGVISDNKEEQKQRQRLARAQNEINQFQYATFNIPMYKKPQVPLIILFVPLWLISLINLGIFFQSSKLGDRMASIITLMLALIAFFPVIREELPPSKKIVLAQYLVYLQVVKNIIVLEQSLKIKQIPQSEWIFDWTKSPDYLVSVAITICSGLVGIIGAIRHCFWLRQQKKQRIKREFNFNSRSKRNPKTSHAKTPNQLIPSGKIFDRAEWQNQDCDKYFNQKFKFFIQYHHKSNQDKQGEVRKIYDYFVIEQRTNNLKNSFIR